MVVGTKSDLLEFDWEKKFVKRTILNVIEQFPELPIETLMSKKLFEKVLLISSLSKSNLKNVRDDILEHTEALFKNKFRTQVPPAYIRLTRYLENIRRTRTFVTLDE